MKKTLLLVVGLLLSFSTLYAQRYPYESADEFMADTIQLSDCRYIVDKLLDFQVRIYNADNHPGRDFPTWKDGSPLRESGDSLNPVHNSAEKRAQLDGIVETTLTKEQRRLIQGLRFYITLNVSSETGNVTDIYFKYNEPYDEPSKIGQIPLEKFREIELRAKEEIVFEPTEVGTKMNYIFLYSVFRAEELPSDDDTPLEQLKPIDNSFSTEIP